MNVVQCSVCKKSLTGGADTFGEVNLPLCQGCWFAFGDDRSQALPVPYTLQIDNEKEIVKALEVNKQ